MFIKRSGDKKRGSKKWFLLAALLIAVFVLISVTLILSRSILNQTSIYRGVYIQGEHVGGMKPKALQEYLEERYGKAVENLTLQLFTEDYEIDFSFKDLGVTVNTTQMYEQAVSVGRKGDGLSRILTIRGLKKNPVDIPLMMDYDAAKLDTLLQDIYRRSHTDLVIPKLVIMENKVLLCIGTSGQDADIEALKEKILKSLYALADAYINIPIKEVRPPAIDVEAIYESIEQDPVNAEIIRKEDGTASVKPQVTGRHIDKAELRAIIQNVEEKVLRDNEEIELPVEFIVPNITTESLKAQLYRDTMSGYSTYFNTNTDNNRNRAVNIKLATESINGKVLFPNDEFSFNTVVGPRTPERGYQIAHIYAEGEVRDGTGGGICQVSTTLYNAVLRANLEVTERHNHTFTVGYVPLGTDAAVSYGYYDLKFKNNTLFPVRIIARVSSQNNISFTIVGTKPNPNTTVKLVTEVVGKIPLTTQYIDDWSLPRGSTELVENGKAGVIVDTYMLKYDEGVFIEKIKLHTSTYQMLPRKVRRGVSMADTL